MILSLVRQKIIYTFIVIMVAIYPLQAERPMFIDDPNVSPYRVLTLEIGNHFDILRSAERPARYINWFDLNLVYGIARDYELSVHVPAGVLIYESDAPDRSEFGSDDFSIALKRIWHTADERWGFGVEGRLFFPVESTPVLGSGKEGFWVNSMADITTGGWIIRMALGFMSPFDTTNEGAVMAGVALRTDFHPARFGFIELYTESPVTSTGEEFPLNVMIGGGLGVYENAILDLGILVGLTDSTVFPGVGLHAGITIEI